MIQNGLLCQGFNTSHVTLYRYQISLRTSGRQVSIHLMLLFICMPPPEMYRKRSFNTSHVTLYLFENQYMQSIFLFQYISCYSLSVQQQHIPDKEKSFQYISCYSLSTGKPFEKGNRISFQYISCYSLSVCRTLIHFYLYSFQYISCYSLSETDSRRSALHLWFQYISCYSLSALKTCYISFLLWFQYISCYSLSAWGICILHHNICFNTSHVTLYRWKKSKKRKRQLGFNTSHVTLYQESASIWKVFQRCFNTSHVTLYLISGNKTSEKWKFQYISCYSLSRGKNFTGEIENSFNTSHVTLYLDGTITGIPDGLVSIHLMLLFIEYFTSATTVTFSFQYISCYSLSKRCDIFIGG